jgi:hypothetical protein
VSGPEAGRRSVEPDEGGKGLFSPPLPVPMTVRLTILFPTFSLLPPLPSFSPSRRRPLRRRASASLHARQRLGLSQASGTGHLA